MCCLYTHTLIYQQESWLPFLPCLTLHEVTHIHTHTLSHPHPITHSPASQKQPHHGDCSTRPREASSRQPSDGEEEMDQGEHGKQRSHSVTAPDT